uniref:Secreted protein n=1 Tax=Haemonchus contortus TaxID=6289 RepID=A0A7I4YJR3_HAECO
STTTATVNMALVIMGTTTIQSMALAIQKALTREVMATTAVTSTADGEVTPREKSMDRTTDLSMTTTMVKGTTARSITKAGSNITTAIMTMDIMDMITTTIITAMDTITITTLMITTTTIITLMDTITISTTTAITTVTTTTELPRRKCSLYLLKVVVNSSEKINISN